VDANDYFDALHEMQRLLGNELLLQFSDYMNSEGDFSDCDAEAKELAVVEMGTAIAERIGDTDEAVATLRAAVERFSAAYVACGLQLAGTSGRA
jgi:hypothetical protein